jgi:hypothetical protein
MTRSRLSIVALVLTVACGPSVLPDNNPQIKTLRRLHQQFAVATNMHMIDVQLDAITASKGIDEAGLPKDLRKWIHDLRVYGPAFYH